MAACGGGDRSRPMLQMRKRKHREAKVLARSHSHSGGTEPRLSLIPEPALHHTLWCLGHSSSAAKREFRWCLQRSELEKANVLICVTLSIKRQGELMLWVHRPGIAPGNCLGKTVQWEPQSISLTLSPPQHTAGCHRPLLGVAACPAGLSI